MLRFLSDQFLVLSLALRNLHRQLRRSSLVMATVAAGCAALFLFDGFNVGIMNQYRANTIRSRYGHGQVNNKNYRDKVFEKPWEHWLDQSEVLISHIKAADGVSYVFPRVEFYSLLSKGNITLSGKGQGVDGPEESKFFTTLNIVEGETLSSQSNGILLGIGLARSLDAKPGDRITLLVNTTKGSMNGADHIVTGIFHTGSKDFDDVAFRIPLASAHSLLDTDKLESVSVGLDEREDWDSFARYMAKVEPTLEVWSFAELDKVYYQNAVDWLGSQFRVIKMIILFIVVLGIFSTVSAAVLERKQEVGNMRANGESRGQVMQLLLTEAGFLGFLGAVFGVVTVLILNSTLLSKGILMPPSPGLTRQFYVLIELQAKSGMEVLLLGFLCSIVGSFFAAIKVVRMPIAEALRSI